MLEVCRLALRVSLSFLFFIFEGERGVEVDSALSRGGGFGGLSGLEWCGMLGGLA